MCQVEKLARKRKAPTLRLPPVTKKQELDAAEGLLALSASGENSGTHNPPEIVEELPLELDKRETKVQAYRGSKGQSDVHTTDASTQTIYNKYILASKIETTVSKNLKASDNTDPSASASSTANQEHNRVGSKPRLLSQKL